MIVLTKMEIITLINRYLNNGYLSSKFSLMQVSLNMKDKNYLFHFYWVFLDKHDATNINQGCVKIVKKFIVHFFFFSVQILLIIIGHYQEHKLSVFFIWSTENCDNIEEYREFLNESYLHILMTWCVIA